MGIISEYHLRQVLQVLQVRPVADLAGGPAVASAALGAEREVDVNIIVMVPELHGHPLTGLQRAYVVLSGVLGEIGDP